ncbi:MAG: hypothetical protein RLY16_3037 [Bacteroidota bacterium]|jgi:hypothetical protein
MERRELIKMIAVLTGGAFVGGDLFLSGCKNSPSLGGLTFSADDLLFLDEIADTILPATSSPGAKTAGVGKFMSVMVNDCYDEKEQKIFHAGITSINEAAKKQYNKPFMDLTAADKTALLNALDKLAKEGAQKVNAGFSNLSKEDWHKIACDRNLTGKDPVKEKLSELPEYYFIQMKQLAILGYFTSKEGATKALRYVAVPGKYDGALPYKKGDKAWAT